MNEIFVFDTVGTLIGSLRIKETEFVLSTPHFDCPFLILGKLGEATKISIYSNDQTCHLCNVGSIVYEISCTPETTNLNQGCDATRSNLVEIFSQKTFETSKMSLS